MISWILSPIMSLIVEVYLWWKLQASLIFLSGRTCTIGGWLNTFLPHCMCSTAILLRRAVEISGLEWDTSVVFIYKKINLSTGHIFEAKNHMVILSYRIHLSKSHLIDIYFLFIMSCRYLLTFLVQKVIKLHYINTVILWLGYYVFNRN